MATSKPVTRPSPALNPDQVEGRAVWDLPDYSSVLQSLSGFFGGKNGVGLGLHKTATCGRAQHLTVWKGLPAETGLKPLGNPFCYTDLQSRIPRR